MRFIQIRGILILASRIYSVSCMYLYSYCNVCYLSCKVHYTFEYTSDLLFKVDFEESKKQERVVIMKGICPQLDKSKFMYPLNTYVYVTLSCNSKLI